MASQSKLWVKTSKSDWKQVREKSHKNGLKIGDNRQNRREQMEMDKKWVTKPDPTGSAHGPRGPSLKAST
jgi:hypothetical protein